LPKALAPLIDALAEIKVEAAVAGMTGGPALAYDGAVAALKKNPIFGIQTDNVLDWGRREAMTLAAAETDAIAAEVEDALAQAVRDGWTVDRFGEALDAVTTSRGLDPAKPWHVETVFRTNVQAAYAGGQWTAARQLAQDGLVAAAEYVAVEDDRARPNHAAMNGWWGPLDSPTWAIWWTPNGWNCRCGIRLLSPEEVEARGGIQAAPAPPAVSPDPGFAGNPGTGLWQAIQKHMF